jgi:hypothetical protein
MCNSWKLPQELTQRMATLQVVNKVLERNSRFAKAWHTAHHDVLVPDDYRLSHNSTSSLYPRDWSGAYFFNLKVSQFGRETFVR